MDQSDSEQQRPLLLALFQLVDPGLGVLDKACPIFLRLGQFNQASDGFFIATAHLHDLPPRFTCDSGIANLDIPDSGDPSVEPDLLFSLDERGLSSQHTHNRLVIPLSLSKGSKPCQRLAILGLVFECIQPGLTSTVLVVVVVVDLCDGQTFAALLGATKTKPRMGEFTAREVSNIA